MKQGMFRVLAVLALMLGLPVQAASGAKPQDAEFSMVEQRVLDTRPWVDDALQCPADVMAQAESEDDVGAEGCQAGRLSECLAGCAANVAGACYWLAQTLEARDKHSKAAGGLFQRACRLGRMSGCTNRAAGMMSEEDQQMCAIRTFDATCKADDPWGCTMSARYFVSGIVVEQDLPRALRALDNACKFGLEDPACVDAVKLRINIRQMMREAATESR
jgi:hypothetical protein